MKINFIVFFVIIIIFNSCFNNNKQKEFENIKESTLNKKVLNKDSDNDDFSNQKNCFVSFDDFFTKFSNDKLFQKKRIHKSIKLIILDPYENKNNIIKKEDEIFVYLDFKVDKNAINNEYDKYKIKINKFKDSVSYKKIGLDNGIYISYIFKRINNCWFLIEIIDEST